MIPEHDTSAENSGGEEAGAVVVFILAYDGVGVGRSANYITNRHEGLVGRFSLVKYLLPPPLLCSLCVGFAASVSLR